MKLLLVALFLISGNVFSKVSCDNVYDASGELVKKAASACNENVRWFLLNKKGNKKTAFVLNDPLEEDAPLLKKPEEFIQIITHKQILQVTKHVEENTLYDLKSMKELKDRSWDDLDFSSEFGNNALIDGVLYVSTFDSGNFLWGFAAAKLGTPLVTARLGAHYNSLTSKKYDKDWGRQFDSDGDQRAISSGHAYFFKTATDKQKKLKYLDYVIP